MSIARFQIFFLLLGFMTFGMSTTSATAQQGDGPLYVGSDACADCHDAEMKAWQNSHHALAWTAPTAETVVADFDGTAFTGAGLSAQFRITDDGYAVHITEPDGSQVDYTVHSVVGIEPLQQYLLETGNGRLQSFDVVWDTAKGEWFHLYPDQDLPPGDGLHWSGPYKSWNARCAECHATDYERNFGVKSQSYASRQSEIGVGCEGCHGPASVHLALVNGDQATQDTPDLDRYGFSMSFNAGDTEAEIQQCAGCHSRRETFLDGNPLPGTPFHDSYALALLRPGLYHADGQVLDEVYVYGSFLQSKMYARGVGCSNCHDAHTAGLKAEGNAVCTQCHSPAGNPDFPSLPLAEYDTPEHHFHAVGTDGAQCKSCHMIERTYMGVDGRRDHSFRIPRPDLGLETGAPDACTDCHTDQTRNWAAEQIAQRFAQSTHRGPHYGQVLARGRADAVAASGDLIGLAQDEAQAGIVRATALYLLVSAPDPALADQAVALLSHPDPLIRAHAAALQRAAPMPDRVTRLMPLLSDPMRSVRVATARSLLDVDPNQLTRSQLAVLGEAMRDWRVSLENKLDFPETHIVFGGMALTTRNFQAAIAAFGEAARLDPQRAEAWSILVRLTHATEGPIAALRILRKARGYLPGDPGLLQLQGEIDR